MANNPVNANRATQSEQQNIEQKDGKSSKIKIKTVAEENSIFAKLQLVSKQSKEKK